MVIENNVLFVGFFGKSWFIIRNTPQLAVGIKL